MRQVQADSPDRTSSSRLVIVAGSGRSGTSTVAGVLKHLGLYVPQPEVEANQTNPRGFFEPRWVVDFQQRLLSECRVPLSDARPEAFRITAEVTSQPGIRAELHEWLARQLAVANEVVIKDPRNTWFLPMWRACGEQVGVAPGFVMMLRHPAEVVGSKQNYYRGPRRGVVQFTGANRTANWINLTLAAEEATRGSRRAFVRYADLVKDWRAAMSDTAEALDLSLRRGFDPAGARLVDDFIDPGLHRVQATWDQIDAPQRLKDLAEEVWGEVGRLADAHGERSASHEALDRLRRGYRDLYEESEAIARSSTQAAVKEARQSRPGVGERQKGPTDTASGRATPVGVRAGRRLRMVATKVGRRLRTGPRATGS